MMVMEENDDPSDTSSIGYIDSETEDELLKFFNPKPKSKPEKKYKPFKPF